MTCLLCGSRQISVSKINVLFCAVETDLVYGQLEQHVASALDTKEFASNPDDIMVRFVLPRSSTPV